MLPLEIDLGPLLPEHLSEPLRRHRPGADRLVRRGQEGRSGLREDLRRPRRPDLRRDREGRGRAGRGCRGAGRVPCPLATAREEASKIREELASRPPRLPPRSARPLREESARLIEHARTQIEAERAQAVQQLRGEIGGLATQLAGKIVGESLDDDARAQRSVERFLAEVESQAETAKA